MKVYIDWADWWVGLYRGPRHLYICPVPCLVIRLPRRRRRPTAAETAEAEARWSAIEGADD